MAFTGGLPILNLRDAILFDPTSIERFLGPLSHSETDPRPPSSGIDRLISGETPLHTAARCGLVKVVHLLLKYKASCFLKNWADKTPLEVANISKPLHLEIVIALEKEMLLEAFKDPDPTDKIALHAMVRFHTASDFINLLQKKSDFQAWIGLHGREALFQAIHFDQTLWVTFLTSNGVSGFDCGTEDASPIEIALNKSPKNPRIITILLDKLPLHLQDEKGRTRLHFECIWGRLERVHFLVEKRAVSMTALDKEGASPRDYAHRSGHADLEKWLRDQIATQTRSSTLTAPSFALPFLERTSLAVIKNPEEIRRRASTASCGSSVGIPSEAEDDGYLDEDDLYLSPASSSSLGNSPNP